MTPKAIVSTKMQGSFADLLPTFEWDLAIKDLLKKYFYGHLVGAAPNLSSVQINCVNT